MTDPTTAQPSDPWHGAEPETPIIGLAHPAGTEPPPAPIVVHAERPRTRRRWLIIAIAAAVLVLGCCGCLGAGLRPVFSQYPAHVTVGERVAGLERSHEAGVDTLTDGVITRIRTEQKVDSAFAALLVDPKAPEQRVVVFGATRFIWNPRGEMTAALRDFGGGGLTDVTLQDYRSTNGDARCANGHDDDGTEMVICIWTDHGSIGAGLFYGGRSLADSGRLFGVIRSEILTRG